jgi:GNAT superfamily N-acetyltransferase
MHSDTAHLDADGPVRAAEAAELDALAQLWHDAWRDAHAHLVPAELARHRTLERFRERLATALAHVRVSGPLRRPDGFCMIREDELYQLFVRAQARGAGAAAALLADGERRLAAAGIRTAWLACAIGNDRAARFYGKRGWHRRGIVTSRLETPDGPFLLDVWRYEKAL